MDDNIFELPNYKYFSSGNIYSSSREGYFHIKVKPGKEDITVFIWYGAFCQEATEPDLITEQVFERSEEGYEQIRAYLETAYQNRRRMVKKSLFEYQFTEEPTKPKETDNGEDRAPEEGL